MDRRGFFGTALLGVTGLAGCRHEQTGEVLSHDKADMVGSHAAGAETFKPLIDEALGKLMARQAAAVHPAAAPAPAPKKMCFIGVENQSIEEIGDFKAQITQIIDTKINTSGTFQQVSGRFMKAGLDAAGLRPDQLFVPDKMELFLKAMKAAGQPIDYLLYATVTSGTTGNNSTRQRDYMLTMELVNIATGSSDKESASLRKAYRNTH